MIVVLDNYDSFTHNLVHLLRLDGEDVRVFRNDEIAVEDVLAMHPRRLVISPGPGRPEVAGISVPLVQAAFGRVPVLGVCLGHQAIGMALGGRVVRAPELVHGKARPVFHDGTGSFTGLASPTSAMRYHSLVLERSSLPPELVVHAWLDDADRTVMGVRHRELDVEGVQFHPESFMTPAGAHLVKNFLGDRVHDGIR